MGDRTEKLRHEDISRIAGLTSFRCDHAIKNCLEAPVRAEKIMAEFLALPSNKTPSPDGYTTEFLEGLGLWWEMKLPKQF